MSSLTWLMMRHGKTRLTPHELPSAEHRVIAIKELMDSSPERDVSLLELAEIAGLSPWHFLRQFKSVVGIPPHAYLVQARIRKAKELLLKGHSIATVSTLCGFTDQSHLNRHFKGSVGITPGEFVQGFL